MTDFVGIRTKLIAELEPVENIEFPAVSGWSAFGSKETGANQNQVDHSNDVAF